MSDSQIQSLQVQVTALSGELAALRHELRQKDPAQQVNSCLGAVITQGESIAPATHGITAQGQAITSLTSKIDTEVIARASADTELATRLTSDNGSVAIDFKEGSIAINSPLCDTAIAYESCVAHDRQVFIDQVMLDSGRVVMAGLNIGGEHSAEQSDFEKVYSQGQDAVLEYFSSLIGKTSLLPSFNAFEAEQIERIRRVLREELRPGGLLHRR